MSRIESSTPKLKALLQHERAQSLYTLFEHIDNLLDRIDTTDRAKFFDAAVYRRRFWSSL